MRIASLAPSNTEILFALGLGEHVVAVTHMCDYPVAAAQKSKIGSWTSTRVDALSEHKPDVIFSSIYYPPELESYDGPGEIVHLNPKTLGDILSSIRTIGEICGKNTEADMLIRRMERELFDLHPPSAFGKQRPSVYMEEWGKPPMASGNWVPQLVTLAGGREVLMHPGEPSREVTLAEIVRADPDMIVLHWCGKGNRVDTAEVASRPGWEQLRAVWSGNIHVIHDTYLNRPGPRIIDGIRFLQKSFHTQWGVDK
ncbi:MAG: cobalamin-binding protein [Patescibacteria group bacterium]|jgi:iron complex transport system substrate-binding protein